MLEIFDVVKNDLKLVEKELGRVVQHKDPLLNETSSHLLNAGGKRLRPAFALLSGKFYHYDLNKIMPLAVALELIHMASLVHDDVVDCAVTRRGRPTVRANWGNRISMHTGDVLSAKALMMIAQYNDIPLVAKVFARTTVKMSEGEIEQIISAYRSDQSIKDYWYRIERKTAMLIADSCQLGAVVCGAPKEIYMPLRRYGHRIGIAFQIVDDILDMIADQDKLGKPIGSDLRQGIVTLPVLYGLKNSTKNKRLAQLVENQNKTEAEIEEAIDIIVSCGGIDYSNNVVDLYVNKAKKELDKLPNTPVRQTLALIADFVRYRKF
ncbi:polyprenyl synthetase family protein [Peptococcaceae bacterium 1198_IL3148]